MLKKFAVQDYIKTITSISLHQGKSMVKLNEIARKLSISSAAVSDMLKKLSREGLIINHAYKGVELTDKGFSMGKRLIRHHRLWEVFLNQVLDVPWDEIHEEAEHLEHAASTSLMNRIDEYLNFPTVDPHGNPIPDKDGNIADMSHELKLLNCSPNSTVRIIRFTSFDPEYLEYISSLGLQVGVELKVIKKLEFDGSVVCRLNYKEMILTELSAKHIFVAPV